MSRKKTEKTPLSFKPFFEEILICNNKKLRPNIEIFSHEAENIEQQRLGTILGVFEITDSSEDSSYIVNYIISIIKKEYFSNPKRGALESFEATLHKANVALSRLAEHGNVNWVGTLHAVVAIIEKNNLHLSQTGSARALLFRSKGLTDISEGLSDAKEEAYPLKTFVNVSSGRLEERDTLIIVTENIFEIFSFEEIKKSLLRFSEEEFSRLLKTALGNELEISGVLIAQIRERETFSAPVPTYSPKAYPHAWSAQAFTKKQPAVTKKNSEDIKKDILKNNDELNRQKTGHIYIKASEEDLENKKASFSEYLSGFISIPREKTNVAWNNLKSTLKESSLGTRDKIKNISLPRWKLKMPKASLPKITFPKIFNKSTPPSSSNAQLVISRLTNIRTIILSKNYAQKIKDSILRYVQSSRNKIAPRVLKIFRLVLSFTRRQKLYSALLLAVLIISPFIFLKIKKQRENALLSLQVPIAPSQEEPKKFSLSELGPNVIALTNIEKIPLAQSLINLIYLNEKSYGIAPNSIISLDDQSSFPVPSEFGEILFAAPMDDLRLIFIFNAKKEAISFSPLSKKFQANNLHSPENAFPSSAGTYLTYLYLLDSDNNQIYRYPRAEGGFGEGSSWIKENISLNGFKEMAINENIFITDEKEILKFFKGKKQKFSIESLSIPLQPKKLFAREDESYFFVLDAKNARVVKIDNNNGSALAQYYHPELEQAKIFTVNEINKLLYILDKAGNIKKANTSN